jgi:[pyruvate, water dikinase]-phosphate phosphotransferase / [pyruvate, water dikinase] kinase
MGKTENRIITLHLVSDATGETLIAVSKSVLVQFPEVSAVERMHMLVRSKRQLQRTLKEIEAQPGLVLYTISNETIAEDLETRCRELKIPCAPVLESVTKVFEEYLGLPHRTTVSRQHSMDESYFRRIEALNFTMEHDDGRLPDDMNDADIVLLGISRTSKTPTGIYLAQRGYKTANVPLVPSLPFPEQLIRKPHKAFVACLIASPDRISEIRRNRSDTLSDRQLEDYIDRTSIAEEISYSRKICARHGWPVIDVTRRSVEETAATIIQLMQDRERETEAVSSDQKSVLS